MPRHQALFVGEEDEDGVVAGQRAFLLAQARLVDGSRQGLGTADGAADDEDQAAPPDGHGRLVEQPHEPAVGIRIGRVGEVVRADVDVAGRRARA